MRRSALCAGAAGVPSITRSRLSGKNAELFGGGEQKSAQFVFEVAATSTTMRQLLSAELRTALAALPSGPEATTFQLRLFEVFLERELWGRKLGAEVLKYPEIVLVDANELEREVGRGLGARLRDFAAPVKVPPHRENI